MWPVEYYFLLDKEIYQIWLILQNKIIIPMDRIFVYKITLALAALSLITHLLVHH